MNGTKKCATISALVPIALHLIGCESSTVADEKSIEGVWRISKIERDYENEPNNKPLPSQIMFTDSHYSIVWMPGNEAMRAFDERWTPSESEIIRRFWEVTVNTGRYQVQDDQIRTEPEIAKFPEFMGGHMIYGIEWSDDDLILTLVDEYSFDGVQPPWATDRGGQQHLTLTRVSE